MVGGGVQSARAPNANGDQTTIEGETEEDKIKAVFQQSSELWNKQSQQLAMYVLNKINTDFATKFAH